MTPTLSGRIQTRIIMVVVLGGAWTTLITPFLPNPHSASIASRYVTLYTALVVVCVAGIFWELVYHGLQQFRWEKDWPTLFGLVVAIPEGILAYLILNAGLPIDRRPRAGSFDAGSIPLTVFVPMFVTVWLLIWAFTNGPMQILSLRWRFRGGRFDSKW
jgi:hypothetical protein